MSKGLKTSFSLTEGKFLLSTGVEKARDAIRFYTLFNKFRVYVSDFGANFVSLLQKPASYIQANSTILLGVYRKGVEKYVPNVKVNTIDVGYLEGDRKTHVIKVEYSIKEEDKTETHDVTFV